MRDLIDCDTWEIIPTFGGLVTMILVLIDNGINGSSGRMLEIFQIWYGIIWDIHMVNYFHRCGQLLINFIIVA